MDPCSVALSVTLDRTTVPTLGSAQLHVAGGSSELQFEFADNRSGGLVSQAGEYVAGRIAGVTDQVDVVDGQCGASERVAISVVEPMQPVPASAEVPPGTSFEVTNEGGSGQLSCTGSLTSGGELEGCRWVAGATSGVDLITVTDPQTAEEATLRFVVDPEASLRVVGERLYVPVGHPFSLEFTGGTQVLDLSPNDAALEVVGRTLTAHRAGTFALVARDRVVDEMEVTVPVVAVDARTAPLLRDGAGLESASVVTGDFDGDGHRDAVVGATEPSVGAFLSGAVYVYAGTAQGLDPDPVAVLSVPQAGAGAGHSVAVGDLDDDGRLDLAVGIEAYDDNQVDQGRIDVFPGSPDGFFSETPAWSVFGGSFDHLGTGVVLCDVDGDGIDDLVGSGFGIEEPGGMRPNEGGIYVWRGGPGGVSGGPDLTMFSGMANFQMGRTLAGGDIDGDGTCDLAASSLTRALDGAGQDGIVWLFTGETLAGTAPFAADRTYSVHTDDDAALFGRGLAFGDVDGHDGADLVVGAFRDDGPGNDRGAVYVFSSADHAAQSSSSPVLGDDAHLVIRGAQDEARLGQGVAVDAGHLWVGAPGAQVVYRFEARALSGEIEATAATEQWTSGVEGFGSAVGPEVTYASLDDAYGVGAGAPWAVPLSGAPVRLGFPADASGGGLGGPGSFTWFDADGNGVFDLMGGTRGAPGEHDPDAGAVHQWSGFDRRWGPTPDRVLAPAGDGERFGSRVVSAGDFDGDGREDLAVVASGAVRPPGFDPERVVNPLECPGAAGDGGALWVFRGGSQRPSFVLYGATLGAEIDVVAGGFDHDGDGLDDLAIGSPDAGATGAFSLVRGHTAFANGTFVLCDVSTWSGVGVGARVGASLAPLGDVDGDGCAELAVGGDGDDLGLQDQGSVRVLFGWGPRCPSHPRPEVATMVSGLAESRFGTALAGGQDADRDGVPDLAVSGVTGQGDGSVWLVSGAWIAGVGRNTAETLPTAGTIRSLVPATSRFDARVAGGGLGRSLGLVADPAAQGEAWVAVGEPAGEVGGTLGAGGVWLLSPDKTGLLQVVGLVGGTSGTPGVGYGAALATDPRTGLLAVGAPSSDIGAVDSGALYPFVVR